MHRDILRAATEGLTSKADTSRHSQIAERLGRLTIVMIFKEAGDEAASRDWNVRVLGALKSEVAHNRRK